MTAFLDAQQAAQKLGVSRQTLYAYVSRGLLSASPDPAARRSLYPAAQVERLLTQRARGRRPGQAVQAALDWGLPVMPSELTLIEEGILYYRGKPALELARTETLEQVACLLWRCEFAEAFGAEAPLLPAGWREQVRRLQSLPGPQRLLALFTMLQAHQFAPLARGNQGRVPAVCGALLRLMTAAVTGGAAGELPVHQQLAAHWQLDDAGSERIRQALVLCADHELNASSFTARCVASTGADLGAVVTGGLAALSGGWHGGMTARVEALLDELVGTRSFRATLRARLARDPYMPGFGHQLYPSGDPRGQALLRGLKIEPVIAHLITRVRELTGLAPSLDIGLVALRRSLGLPVGSAFEVFAIGRSVGWLAHALEQRELRQLIRPRAAYVGPRPAAPAPPPGRVVRAR